MDRFADHRRRLAELIGPEGLAVVPASVEVTRNSDVEHPFRQDSDFYYLTGFTEPEAVCVLAPGHDDGDFFLFVRPRDREMEIWNGYRAGVEGAEKIFGADRAYELSRLDEILSKLVVGREAIFYCLGNRQHDPRITALVAKARSYRDRLGKPSPDRIVDVSRPLADLRIRKSEEEIESLRAACELSAEGHREAMRFAEPGMYEYQVQAAMEFVWREGGSERNGYPSIVASGPNAVVLHYTENDRQIEGSDLILIDAACEVDHYSSDITRTFPASGEFSAAQHALYDVVLTAQRAAIARCSPGATLRDVHETAKAYLTEGLIDLGLLPGSVEDAMAMHHYREFFMHGTSHWLGLDVHDVGPYRNVSGHVPLEEGMVFTVEPGIYVSPDRDEIELHLLEYDLDQWSERRITKGVDAARREEDEEKEGARRISHRIPPEFRGLGVRIEDDILMTQEGHENLSRLAPTSPDEIEELCKEPSWMRR